MNKSRLFLAGWAVSTLLGAILAMALMPRERVAAMVVMAALIGSLGGVIVLLLSYRYELKRLRTFRDFIGVQLPDDALQKLVHTLLTDTALVARHSRESLDALYARGIHGVYGKTSRGAEPGAFKKEEGRVLFCLGMYERAFNRLYDDICIVKRISNNRIDLKKRLPS
ncbi:hypothetical protein KW784_02200, partial [Candidatus Parcubacteria bacterium]|nr:hypothetical protein [Candidatus Parcubacteria bacterium]